MTDTTKNLSMVDEQESSSSSTKCTRRLCLTLAFSSLTASVATFLIVVFLFEYCPDCQQSLRHRNESYIVTILGTIATLLFFLGGGILTACWRRGQNSTTEGVPQVVVSLIPDEDLEKSPAPILPYNHIPRHQPFVMKASSLDVPGYSTVVKNIDEVYPSVNPKVWSEDFPETPPPCYEEAIKMKTIAVTINVTDTNISQRDNTEDTRV